MVVARNDTPAWQEPAGEEPVTAARPALATLSKSGRVKLKLGQMAYDEACRVVEALAVVFDGDVTQRRNLTPELADTWGSLALLQDTWEYQLEPHQLRQPEVVTVTLSRCEALVLWKLWHYSTIPVTAAPAYAAVMDELQNLLGSHHEPRR